MISKVPRTGAIKLASPCLDYISIKAFLKEGITKSINKEKFLNWIPLYFGQNIERTLHLGTKGISYIFTNSTKRF